MNNLPRLVALLLLCVSSQILAEDIQLNTFQNGNAADADKVNENFNNLKTAIESASSAGHLIINRYEETFNHQYICKDYQVDTDGDGIIGPIPCMNNIATFSKTLACEKADEKPISGGCRLNADSNTDTNGRFLHTYTDSSGHSCLYEGDQVFTMTIFVNCIGQ